MSFNFEDVKNLRVRLENESNFRGVDILLTHQWPGGVETAAAIKPEEKPGSPSTLVALLAAALKPRYHFAAGGEDMNYERVKNWLLFFLIILNNCHNFDFLTSLGTVS